MTTLRHRRALSMHRRPGAQTPTDGRTPRHAQGWRDLQPQEEDARGMQFVLLAVGYAAAGFASIWAVVYIAVWILDNLL